MGNSAIMPESYVPLPCVTSTPFNCKPRLLSQNEAVLLYPGGAREAFKVGRGGTFGSGEDKTDIDLSNGGCLPPSHIWCIIWTIPHLTLTRGCCPSTSASLHSFLQRKGEKYKLLWPKRQEFVRMACRFGATIIPFAAIGADDGVNIVRDSAELMATPIIGDWIKSNTMGAAGD